MDKDQFFIEALQADKHLLKQWVLCAFCVVEDREYQPDNALSYDIVTKGNEKTLYFVDPLDKGNLIPLNGTDRNEPPFIPNEALVLPPNSLPNVKQMIKTTFGTALVNAMVLVWPFGNKIDYISGRWDGGKVDKLIASHLVDYPVTDWADEGSMEFKIKDPEYLAKLPQGTVEKPFIYIHELHHYYKAMANLAGYTQVVTPAASPKSLTVDPAIIKRRDELLAQHRDELKDPAIVAKIVAELAAMDKASFKGDPAAGFMIKSKAFDISRMKAYILYGLEYGFNDGNEPAFIPTSLNEGMDLNSVTEQINGLRAGSYSRGALTALGGAGVKEIYRILQNATVSDKPCNSQMGVLFTIEKQLIEHLTDRYAVNPADKKAILLTPQLLEKNIGKSIIVRTPGYCQSPDLSYCPHCLGVAYSRNKTGLHSVGADVLSVIMNDFMKAMHGKKLATTRYNYLTRLS